MTFRWLRRAYLTSLRCERVQAWQIRMQAKWRCGSTVGAMY